MAQDTNLSCFEVLKHVLSTYTKYYNLLYHDTINLLENKLNHLLILVDSPEINSVNLKLSVC